TPAFEQVVARPRKPEMRPVELVRGAEENVDAGVGDLDVPVRSVVDGVAPGERADRVRELDDVLDRYDGADGVRRPREGDDARSVRQKRADVGEVERAFLA